MATAMQAETVVPKPQRQSAAERMFWSLLPYPKTPDSDNRLCGYAQVCVTEAEDAAKAAAPDQWCFGVGVTVRGRWAANVISHEQMTMKSYPKTKKNLCMYIADGWLGCRERDDEKFFVGVLQRWPIEEAKEAADVVRQMIEMRLHVGNLEEICRLARFFVGYTPTRNNESEVWRTVFKAIGKYANVNDLIVLGQALNLVHGELRKPFYDFVQNGNHQ